MLSSDFWAPQLIRIPYSSATIVGNAANQSCILNLPKNGLVHGAVLMFSQTTRGTTATSSPTIKISVSNAGLSLLDSGSLNIANGIYVANGNADPDANGQMVWLPAVQSRRFALINGAMKDLGSGYWLGASTKNARYVAQGSGLRIVLTFTQAANATKDGTLVAPSAYILITPVPIGVQMPMDVSSVLRFDEAAARHLCGIGLLGGESFYGRTCI